MNDSSIKSQLALSIMRMSLSESVLTSSEERIGSCWLEVVGYSILINGAEYSGGARGAYFFWLAIIVKTKVVREVAVLTTLSQVPTLLLGLMLAV